MSLPTDSAKDDAARDLDAAETATIMMMLNAIMRYPWDAMWKKSPSGQQSPKTVVLRDMEYALIVAIELLQEWPKIRVIV